MKDYLLDTPKEYANGFYSHAPYLLLGLLTGSLAMIPIVGVASCFITLGISVTLSVLFWVFVVCPFADRCKKRGWK